jgi:hypothetical protein
MEEQELDSTTLLDYLMHALIGYVIGLLIYCLYLIVARIQGRLDDEGFVMVWGVRMTTVINTGLLSPPISVAAGILQGWLAPVSYLRSRSWAVFLVIGALLLSVVAFWLAKSTIVQLFKFQLF